MTEREWICCYINSKGKEVSKIFDDIETGLKFIRLLDKRIEKGTCGGYVPVTNFQQKRSRAVRNYVCGG